MKKLITILLATAIILCLFCGCGEKHTKFEDEKSLLSHMTGVWNTDISEYMLFNDNKIYLIDELEIESLINDYLLDLAKKDYAKFEQVTAEECLTYVDSNLEDYIFEDYTINPKKGRIILGENAYYVVFEDTLKRIGKTKDGTFECDMISKTPSLNIEEFKDLYKSIKDDFELSVSDFKSSTKECAEKIKKNHTDIQSLKQAHKDVSTQIYTDTGYSSNNTYNTLFMVTNNNVVYTRYIGAKKYTFTYTPNLCSLAHDATGKISLKKLVDDALTCVSDFPLALTTEELIELFEEEKEYNYGGYTFSTTKDGVDYSITDSGKTLVVRIGLD